MNLSNEMRPKFIVVGPTQIYIKTFYLSRTAVTKLRPTGRMGVYSNTEINIKVSVVKPQEMY